MSKPTHRRVKRRGEGFLLYLDLQWAYARWKDGDPLLNAGYIGLLIVAGDICQMWICISLRFVETVT
jgi:hypothetical protein